jgi:hypothetical protein
MKRMKEYLITGGLIVGALVAPALAMADDTATPVPTPTPLAWYQKLTVGGYIDEYYQLSFNDPQSTFTGPLGFPSPYRPFNPLVNQFAFGGGELTLKQSDSASGTGYFVDLLLGPTASLYTGASIISQETYADQLLLGQAYVTQAFGNATFTLGKFGTPVGYEVTYLPSDANFSRSLLYNAEPLYHTGLELAYTLPMSFTATGWIGDGQNVEVTGNRGKDYGAQLGFAGITNLDLIGTWYLDEANTDAGQLYSTNDANFIATYTLGSSFTFAGEYLLTEFSLLGNPAYAGGPHYNPIAQGYALYATYNTPIANLSLSPRFEQWYSPDDAALGYAGLAPAVPANVTDDYTLTLKYQMGPLAHILEYRADAINPSSVAAAGFSTAENNKANFLSEVNQTLTYAAVYSF